MVFEVLNKTKMCENKKKGKGKKFVQAEIGKILISMTLPFEGLIPILFMPSPEEIMLCWVLMLIEKQKSKFMNRSSSESPQTENEILSITWKDPMLSCYFYHKFLHKFLIDLILVTTKRRLKDIQFCSSLLIQKNQCN